MSFWEKENAPEGAEPWEFAGWGEAKRIENLGSDPVKVSELGVSSKDTDQLGELRATAICGNDITSSVLYVSALTIGVAGIYAPLGLLLVSLVLYGFRKVYGEVGSALPMNGGAYTVLLNTTNKKLAATAATLTIISYLATAVISATEAMHYLGSALGSLPYIPATIGLLGLFAFLTIIGIKESSTVAVGIFLIHIGTLILLSLFSLWAFFMVGPSEAFRRAIEFMPETSPVVGIAVGFCAGMLGISGFESSANYIEEQKPGVFPKTLRNMWLAITVFNPLICIVALGILGSGAANNYEGSFLSSLAEQTGGVWLKHLVAVSAVLVLSGAVLTSYVGVIGLIRRMALDRCLPQVMLAENKWRGTNHWIILSFFALCCGVLIATGGSVPKLAGVYSLSFLSVMALFAMGNLFLKNTRNRLPRTEKANLSVVLGCFVAVAIAMLVNMTVESIETLSLLFIVIGGTVAVMFSRILILRFVLFLLQHLVDSLPVLARFFRQTIYSMIHKVVAEPIVYFSRGDDVPTLNRMALYVMENEQSNHLIVVNVYEKEEDISPELASVLRMIDLIYPELRIDFLAVKGKFGPQLVEKLSRRLRIPKNYMFIGTPSAKFKHSLSELGGVRIII